jgi:hypothetical protein
MPIFLGFQRNSTLRIEGRSATMGLEVSPLTIGVAFVFHIPCLNLDFRIRYQKPFSKSSHVSKAGNDFELTVISKISTISKELRNVAMTVLASGQAQEDFV